VLCFHSTEQRFDHVEIHWGVKYYSLSLLLYNPQIHNYSLPVKFMFSVSLYFCHYGAVTLLLVRLVVASLWMDLV
jgi:hypothetical protein